MSTPAPQTQTFNANGNFTVPDCINTITVAAIGGGGGGGDAMQDGSQSGGGGGEGGWYASSTVSVTPGWVCPVEVGSGGSAGSNGGYSRFRLPSLSVVALASGGRGASSAAGAGGDGTPLTPNVGSIKRDGGVGGNGTQFGGGGGGSSAGTSAAGNSGADGVAEAGGAGGGAPTGGGSGAAGGNQNTNGDVGSAPGGAGSGAGGGGANTGGSGATGRVVVSWVQELQVMEVLVSGAGNYAVGNQVTILVVTSQAATVNTGGGSPTVSFAIGGQNRQASYSGSSGTSLFFRYTVTAADNGLSGLVTGTGITLNGATIRDGCGSNFDVTFPSVSQAGFTAGANGPFNFFEQGPSAFGSVRTGFTPQMLGD